MLRLKQQKRVKLDVHIEINNFNLTYFTTLKTALDIIFEQRITFNKAAGYKTNS